MLNVLLLGATGTFGSVLAKKLAEESKCCVTLFARHTGSIKVSGENVKIICGDAANINDLKAAVRGQDVVYSAISGSQLPQIAKNLVSVMPECNVNRLIFMGAVGIYNEIPEKIGGQYNVDNEPPQIPNRRAVDVIEASNLNYTILRPGFLRNGREDDFILTLKGEAARGYVTTIPSILKLALEVIHDETLYSRESVSITQDATRDKAIQQK